jgi:hypothetical protein
MGGRRLSRRAAIAAALVLAVLLGGGAAALVAASGDDESGGTPVAGATGSTRSSTAPRTATETTTSSTSTSETSSTATTPSTETDTQTSQAPPAPPAEPPSSVGDSSAKHRLVKVPPAHVFSGTGTTWLGTIELSKAAVVRWSAAGKLSIRFGRERFPVIAPSHSGQLAVPPYSFELVRVISDGRWRIEVTPQG